MLAAFCWIPLKAAPEQYEGKAVASIRFDPEPQQLTRDQLLAIIPLQVGKPLLASDVRDSMERLYRTGEYADISVGATLTPAGVAVTFFTKPTYFTGNVAVDGVPEPPNQDELRVATKLQLGTGYTPDDMNPAVERITEVLKRNGFYSVDVQPITGEDDATQQVQIDFAIDPGDRAKFDGLDLTGNALRTQDQLIRSSAWKRFFGLFGGWKPLTENRLQNGVENIRSWYPKHDHLLARVTVDRLDYHPDTNTVTPVLSIDTGPPVVVRLRGAKLSAGKLRSLLPIYEERAVDRDLLEEGTRDLAAYFQSQGYFDAKVSYLAASSANGEQLIYYDAVLGIRHTIVKVAIEGNHYFDDETLRERMTVTPAAFLRYRRGRFSRAALDRDLDAIRDLYRNNGFRDVDVTSRVVDDFAGHEGDVAIFIEINEGPQWFVSKLRFQGVEEDYEAALRLILHSTEGQPYSDLNIATDRDNILDYYYNNGYPEAKLDFTSTPAPEPDHMDLTYIVTPGRRVYVRNVLIDGLRRTRPSLVRSRISLEPGDPLSQNQITASQRRLYDLGIFARVDAAIQNPDGEEPTKYVDYSLEEAARYSMNIGFGAEIGNIGGGTTSLDSPAGTEGFSPRFIYGVSRSDFLGLGHTVGMQSLVSTLEQRVVINYLAPQFEGNPNLNLQFSGLFDISHDVRTFSARREEASVQLGQKLTRDLSLQYRLTFRQVNILGTPLITPELIPLLSQPVRVGLASMSFIQDRRDDPTDPHRGIYNSIDVAIAAKALLSQTGYGRVLMRNATYYPLSKNVVFARSTDFGFIERYAGLPEIPLPERFFAGGPFSNRAFPDFQAGPRDLTTGFPIGGNALLVNSMELRFPLIGDNIGGVLFNDFGNVYSTLGDVSLRFRQENLEDFNYAVQAFGFGIRYRTPIGPVRLDFSLSPDSPRFFGCQGSVNQLYSCGVAGSNVPQTVQRINQFQFQFTLGQAF